MTNAADLNQFLASVEKRAYAMTKLAVQNPDDALDIVQDAMMTLARKYARKPPAEWPPLFYRILRNRTTDFHRANTVRRKWFVWGSGQEDDDLDPIAAAPADEIETPEQRLDQTQAATRLQEALQQLPPRQREAFVLRAWQGLDVRETAQAMGVSQGSVKTHYSRAVHALRGLLEALEHDRS